MSTDPHASFRMAASAADSTCRKLGTCGGSRYSAQRKDYWSPPSATALSHAQAWESGSHRPEDRYDRHGAPPLPLPADPCHFNHLTGQWEPKGCDNAHGHHDRPRVLLPSPTTWTQECVTTGQLRTIAQDCAPPYIETQTLDDVAAMDVFALADNLNVHFDLDWRGDYLTDSAASRPEYNHVYGGADAELLLLRAWALLRTNSDLLRFAACWIGGADAVALDCLTNRINGSGPHFTITLDQVFCRNAAETSPILQDSGGRTRICVDNAWWRAMVDAWRRIAADGLEAERNQLCAAIEVCCGIAHELAHSCRLGGSANRDRSGDLCATSYLLQSIFRWLLLSRYPDAIQSPCCAGSFTGPDGGINPLIIGGGELALYLRNCE